MIQSVLVSEAQNGSSEEFGNFSALAAKASSSLHSQARWLTEKAVSTHTGISVSTLQKWRMRQTGIKYSKLGRSVRYDLRDVEQFMSEHSININHL